MRPASHYHTDYRHPDKTKPSSARTRAALRLSGRRGRAAVLALFAATFTVLHASALYAWPAGPRAAAYAAPEASAAPAVERDFAPGFFPAAFFQLAGESVETYDSDCTTPKSVFTLGNTVCVKASVPFTLLRNINVVGPANVVRGSLGMSGLTQTFSFTLPSTAQTIIGDETFDNRGTWRADLSTIFGGRRATVFFDVSGTTAAADLQIVAGINGDGTVNSGDPLTATVYVLNSGPDDAQNVVVTPPTNSGLNLQSFAPENGDDCEGPCTIASLAKHSAAKFIATYNVTAANGTKLAALATAQSTAMGETPATDDPRPDSNSDAIFVTVGTVNPDETCTLTCPDDIVVTANTTVGGESGAFVQYSAAGGSGDCGAITNNPAPDQTTGTRFFTVGTHTVISTSETGGGSCTFIVNVVDTPAPTISCPANKFATDTDKSGDETVAVGTPTYTASSVATVTGVRSDNTPAVVDSEGNIITPAQPRALTDPYPVGVTSILWTVTDADGRTASCTQTVTVAGITCGSGDTTPPTITAPPDLTLSTGASGGACGLIVGETELRGGLEDDEIASDAGGCAVSISRTGVPAGNFFPVGTTTVTWKATDAAGNTTSDTQTVTILENTPPIIFAPADASYSCPEQVPAASPSQAGGPLLDGSGVPVVDDNGNFVPGGQPYDNCGVPTVTVTETSSGTGTSASPRVILRTFKATDASGNMATATQTITVIDDTPPTISAPPAVTAYTGAGAASCDALVSDATLGTASAQDNCAGVTVSRSPAGNTFPVGTTDVTWTATDWAGNTATAHQSVTVVDNTAPVVTPPAAVTLYTGAGATSCDVTVSNLDGTLGTGSATDNCPGVGAVTRSGVPSGNVFPEGTTTLTYSVTDAHGNTASATQTVTVVDNTAPVISCPVNIVLEPSCPLGAVATYTAPVGTDNCPGATTTRTAGLASGSVFPIGTTTVTHTVNDAHGNSASCSFTVKVKTPAEVVQDLKVRVQALQPPLSGTQVQGLTSKLDAALSAINNDQKNVACNKLADFISQVTAFINNGTLTPAQGQPLINSAAKVRNTLGCTSNGCT